MRLCLLADAGSVHTQRWAASLSERGHDVTVLSLRPADLGTVRVIQLAPPRVLSKLGYLAVAHRVGAFLDELRPDLLHAHYATSYGLLGALSGFHPLVVSAWGADVFDFPRRSPLHSRLVRYNLSRADVVASTSRFMGAEVRRYTDKDVEVTPFGVDMTRFTPAAPRRRDPGDGVTIGLVKALEEKYGVRVLVDAFELVAGSHPDLRLTIVGGGSQRAALDATIRRSRFASRVRLLPAVPHLEVPQMLRQMDVFAVPSIADSESFGVAAIEASACGLPVVASRVGGLPEVVIDGETGILVPPGDPAALARALEPLVESDELRRRLGANGRAFVERVYDWSDSVDVMERLYAEVCRPARERSARLGR
jgi:glycosyltransferase involved in cell wall biosynthesis